MNWMTKLTYKDYRDKCDEVKEITAENKILKQFAREVIKEVCWDIGGTSIRDLDGGDVQSFAERLGLIVPHVVTEIDIDEECDYEVGDTIYRFSEILK